MPDPWLRRDWIAPGMTLIEQGGKTGKLYVLNRISNTLGVIDTTTQSVISEVPVGAFVSQNELVQLLDIPLQPLFGSGVDPLIRLGDNLRRGPQEPVLSYTTSTADDVYLRLAVLENFTGATWMPNEADRYRVGQRWGSRLRLRAARDEVRAVDGRAGPRQDHVRHGEHRQPAARRADHRAALRGIRVTARTRRERTCERCLRRAGRRAQDRAAPSHVGPLHVARPVLGPAARELRSAAVVVGDAAIQRVLEVPRPRCDRPAGRPLSRDGLRHG